MPQVPYTPYPTQQPEGRGTPTVHVDTPIAAFGGAVAQATESLGKDISHAGDELFTRAMALQQLRNETEAKEADAEYMKQAGEAHARYSALEGKAAVDGLKGHNEELDTLRKNIRSNLSSDVARRMYDAQSLSTMGRSIFNASGHAATENKRYTVGTIQARQDLRVKDIEDYPGDEKGYSETLAGIQEDADNMAPIHGWSEPQKEKYVKEQSSKALSNRILGMAKTEPLKANELYEQHKADLFGADRTRVETGVQNQMRTMYSRNISNKVLVDLHDDPDELRQSTTLNKRIQAGVEMATKEAPNVPGLEDAVRDRIQSDYAKIKRITSDDNRAQVDTVGNAVLGLSTLGGKLPTTMEELTADPRVADAIDKLRPTQRRQVEKALAQNAKGDVNETPERRDRYYELLGMASTKPADFLDVDVTKEDIPNKLKTELFKKQLAVQKGASEDPRLTRAMQTMQPDLEAIGYGLGKSRDLYYKFKGQFQMAMEDYISENKKAPDAKTVREIGARLLREQVTPGTIFGNIWPNRTKLFEMDVPQNDIDEIKANIQKERPGMEISDDQLRREVIRQRYNKLYKGAPKSSTEDKPAFTPTVPQSK